MTVLDYRSAPPRETERTQGHWLGWAVYLAMSWTWCIGMFLPVLLLRDYGIWGFVVFAVPNVLGAAAMGWVMQSPDISRSIAASHHPALAAFALVTAAYQIFFACWILPWVDLGGVDLTKLALGLSVLMLIGMAFREQVGLALGWAVLIASALCLWGTLHSRAAQFWPVWWSQLSEKPPSSVLYFTPLCVFGFLLCPYLDPTFHRARVHLDTTGARRAFGTGFGILFTIVLICVLFYALPVRNWLWNVPRLRGDAFARWFGAFVVIQLSFTIALHWKCGGIIRENISLPRVLMLVVGSSALGVSAWLSTRFIWRTWLEAGELIYRLFLGFYALVFPAYVWLCMIPLPYAKPSQRSLIVFAIAVVIAAPMFWMGFINGKMIWLLPGLGVVLLARLLVPRVRAPRQIPQ